MSNITKGVLIFNEWFEAMKGLNPKDYKLLLNAIYNTQIHDLPTPEFTGKSKIVAAMIFPCIERRKAQSMRGRLGAESRYASFKKESNVEQSFANSGAIGSAVNQSKVKKNKAEYSIEESSKADSTPDFESCQDSLALSEKAQDVILETDRGYGTYKNVYLCTEEYLKIKNTIPNADSYIDLFSQKLHHKGYRYPNHANAILDWYEKDKNLPAGRQNSEPPLEHKGSFDTDEFFEAAVRRSLGSDKK